MVVTAYLELVLSLSKHISYHVINLKRELLICVNTVVAGTVTVCALKVILLCNTSFSVLRRLNHLSFDTFLAGNSSTANHIYWFTRAKVISLFALKAFH